MPHGCPLISALVAATAVLFVAGCGGGSTSAASIADTGALAFARCMRAHGVPNWPDPNTSGAFDKSKLRQLRVTPARVRALEQGACDHLLRDTGPEETAQQQHARLAAALAFAHCMRERGLSGFPDPTNQGELTPEMVTAAGIDLHQPKLLAAGLACVSVTHGLLTRAAIERAVHGG